MTFQQRSYKKELLDGDALPFSDIKQNMQELNTINHWLGGHKITLQGLKEILPGIPAGEISIAEIGCGGGDNLRVIKNWAAQHKLQVSLIGIDINPECILFAEKQPSNNGIHFICSDYKKVLFPQSPHIIFSSLFCHHFTNEELVQMLQWMYANSKQGFFINDLHRHPLAFYSIKLLTTLFSKSYLVKNDAPLSVQRSFVKSDWLNLLQTSGITSYHIHWKWAFRWLVTVLK